MKKEVKVIQNYGEPSYCFENHSIKVYITEKSGRMTADFQVNGTVINPYYMAPWWNEPSDDAESAMRGSWFCFPFGLNEEPYQGIQYPCHGFPLTISYEQTDYSCSEEKQTLCLKGELKEDHAQLEKCFTLYEGDACIYISDKVTGATGKYPAGYHPTLRIPETIGSALIDFSKPLESWTAPVHIEDPAKGGYSSLLQGQEMTDLTRVPTVYGQTVDVTRHPFIKGFDDIYMHVSDPSKEFSFMTISIPEEGYLYFHLKNPRNLGNEMFWTSYNGRYYTPWNGRVNGCVGVEEINGYFCYGMTSAQEENPFTSKGYHMYDEFDGGEKEYRMIQGVVPIEKDYQGVADVVKVDDYQIAIIGKDGSKKIVSCRTGFLTEI